MGSLAASIVLSLTDGLGETNNFHPGAFQLMRRKEMQSIEINEKTFVYTRNKGHKRFSQWIIVSQNGLPNASGDP